MYLLDACLEKNVRLMDYEKLCDERGRLSAVHTRASSDLMTFLVFLLLIIISLYWREYLINYLQETEWLPLASLPASPG